MLTDRQIVKLIIFKLKNLEKQFEKDHLKNKQETSKTIGKQQVTTEIDTSAFDNSKGYIL